MPAPRILFREVQSILTNPNKDKSRKDLFTFSNLITCGVCGCSITAQIQKKKYIYYHCSGYKGNCNQPYVREEVLNQAMLSLLQDIQVPDDAQEMILNGMRENFKEKINYHNTCIEQTEKQIKVLQSRINQSYTDKLDGKISEDFWSTQNNRWCAEKENLLIKLSSYQKTDTSRLGEVTFVLELAKKAPELFKRANIMQKRKLTGILFSNCSLKDQSLDLELKPPFDMIRQSSITGNWRP